VNVVGKTIFGENPRRDIWTCGPGAYVVVESLAFRNRGENKDAYDLIYVGTQSRPASSGHSCTPRWLRIAREGTRVAAPLPGRGDGNRLRSTAVPRLEMGPTSPMGFEADVVAGMRSVTAHVCVGKTAGQCEST